MHCFYHMALNLCDILQHSQQYSDLSCMSHKANVPFLLSILLLRSLLYVMHNSKTRLKYKMYIVYIFVVVVVF